MPLDQAQIEILSRAIEDYSFPAVYFDFNRDIPDDKGNIAELEILIKQELISNDSLRVKNGLSNVLYWGYSQMGIRDTRVRRFRDKATAKQLNAAATLFQKSQPPALIEIKRIVLPEFSGISFVSKIRMFLDPQNSATLDFQIMKIREVCPNTVLNRIQLRETQIPITMHNSNAYEYWCRKNKEIARRYFGEQLRSVDIERGFFHLVQRGQVRVAANILEKA